MKYEDLGINGTTLVYRRSIENMPLTTIPEDATPEMVEKRKLARRKILNNTLDKFLFKVAECTQPVGLSYEDNILNGIEVIENKINFTIDLVERWYIWPYPIFEISERNFNSLVE